MKLNPNYAVKNMLGETILIPIGEAIEGFHGMISMNEVASFMFEHMEECENYDEMVKLVLDEFDIDEETAKKDVYGFLDTLKQTGFIAKDE